MYRSRPAIPADLRRTVEEQRRTINELRQQVADLSRRIAAADTADGEDRRALAGDLQMLQRLLISYADDLKALYRTVRQQGRRLRVGTHDVVRVLVNAIESRDAGSAKHARHVAAVAERLGQQLQLDGVTLHAVHLGGLLHDVGNVILDRDLTATPGPLSREQWTKVREHPIVGGTLVAEVPSLAAAAPIIRHHHERWDGKGYPDGLAGEDIPLGARIVALAEAFVSMVAARPYRAGHAAKKAVEQIGAGRDTQFDPQCVDAFLAAWEAGEIPLGDAAS